MWPSVDVLVISLIQISDCIENCRISWAPSMSASISMIDKYSSSSQATCSISQISNVVEVAVQKERKTLSFHYILVESEAERTSCHSCQAT